MVIKKRKLDRERIAGTIILISIMVIIMSVISIRFLDVHVSNIEFVDQGLYTVITDNGAINVSKDDILRIERTYAKAAVTGTPVELDRIYTTKGFIYFSSLDPFYQTGHQLINSADFVGGPVWIKSDKNQATESVQIRNQLLNANLRSVQPFSYAIGTPPTLISLVFSVLNLQYLALTIGGIALVILVFPMRSEPPIPAQSRIQGEQEYSSSEEGIGAVAK